jgi:peptidoglycan/xylan/chitin deacetylase (PgdA/CDA1 family)
MGRMQALSLMYHDVVEGDNWDASGFPGPWPAAYKLARSDFHAHIQAIRSATEGKAFCAVNRVADWSSRRPVFLTFDDGGVSAASLIADLLEAIGCPGHFFVTTDYIGSAGFLDAAQIRDLRRRGHIIGSHSCSHPRRMAACSVEQLRREWTESVSVLSDLLGESVTVASVPGGYYSTAVGETAAETGIRFLFTSEPTPHVSSIGACRLLGRYAVRRSTPAYLAARYASGHLPTLWKDSLWWQTKKMMKFIGGRAWVALGERMHR